MKRAPQNAGPAIDPPVHCRNVELKISSLPAALYSAIRRCDVQFTPDVGRFCCIQRRLQAG